MKAIGSTIDRAVLGEVRERCQAVQHQIAKAYIGNRETVEVLLTALLARGHVLLEGVPGVAKTTLCKAFSTALGCSFRRIQFTPDLLPSDITGTHILDQRTLTFVLREGPIFAQVVLGDEINRAPAKTQSALLEAMQEAQVTIEGETRHLEPPFLVLATQNPIDHEGTYALPEAQVDRFLVKLPVGYPGADDEKLMLLLRSRPQAEVATVLSPHDVLKLQGLADAVHVDEEIIDYVLALVHFTRRHRRVALGASPRAALGLLQASKARALLGGRDYVLPDDTKRLAPFVLGHRLVLSPEAELEGIQPLSIVLEGLERVAIRPPRTTGSGSVT
ncbi:MAG TPA: MoxR family ATPase [Polyangia bacterium]|nr:MoxR family ATPase [Polyangia bacterium]